MSVTLRILNFLGQVEQVNVFTRPWTSPKNHKARIVRFVSRVRVGDKERNKEWNYALTMQISASHLLRFIHFARYPPSVSIITKRITGQGFARTRRVFLVVSTNLNEILRNNYIVKINTQRQLKTRYLFWEIKWRKRFAVELNFSKSFINAVSRIILFCWN